jgi:HD-like signal output (HDOD) protein
MTTTAGPKTVDLARLLSGAQLPALPQSAIKLLELSRDPDNGPAEFAVPIEADPGLTGQVLRFVNSSYFGFSNEISTVKLAITMVGVHTIKNFALWSAVFSLMPNPKCGPFDLKSLWQDSLRRGLFARTFAKPLGVKESEEAFAAALLQDMAVPLLAKELPTEYTRLLEQRDGGRVRLSDLEQQQFGWTHAQAAGAMARKWKLPEDFAQLVESHVQLDATLAEPRRHPGKLAVGLSALLPSASDGGWLDLPRFEQAYQSVCPAGGPSVAQILETTDAAYAEFAPVLKVATSAKSLSACYAEAALVAAG